MYKMETPNGLWPARKINLSTFNIYSAVLFSHDLGDTQEKEASKIKGCVLLDTTLQPLCPSHWTLSKTINMGLWDGHHLSYPGGLQNRDFDEQTKCFLRSYWERMKLFPEINPWHLKLPNQYELSSDSHPNTLQININPNEGQEENNWLHFKRQRKKNWQSNVQSSTKVFRHLTMHAWWSLI